MNGRLIFADHFFEIFVVNVKTSFDDVGFFG